MGTVSNDGNVSYVGSGYVYVGTMASATPATNFPIGTKAFFTNVGINGTDMTVSASGKWIPHNGRALLSQLTLPVLKACTIPADASATANGAITFGTAINTVFSRCYCYFDANVVNGTQPAGFYPTEFSTTTAAIVYNNIYTPAVGAYPTWPSSPTAFSGAVPGGAGSTAEITAFIYKLNGGLLGLYGSLITEVYFESTTGGNGKTFRNRLGGSITHVQAPTSSPMLHSFIETKNLGSQSRQRSNGIFRVIEAAGIAVATTIDTSADVEVSLTLQTSVATDWSAFSFINANVEVA